MNTSSRLTGVIADHPTPKFQTGEKAAYTLNSRDYKGIMVVVLDINVAPEATTYTGAAAEEQYDLLHR